MQNSSHLVPCMAAHGCPACRMHIGCTLDTWTFGVSFGYFESSSIPMLSVWDAKDLEVWNQDLRDLEKRKSINVNDLQRVWESSGTARDAP